MVCTVTQNNHDNFPRKDLNLPNERELLLLVILHVGSPGTPCCLLSCSNFLVGWIAISIFAQLKLICKVILVAAPGNYCCVAAQTNFDVITSHAGHTNSTVGQYGGNFLENEGSLLITDFLKREVSNGHPRIDTQCTDCLARDHLMVKTKSLWLTKPPSKFGGGWTSNWRKESLRFWEKLEIMLNVQLPHYCPVRGFDGLREALRSWWNCLVWRSSSTVLAVWESGAI